MYTKGGSMAVTSPVILSELNRSLANDSRVEGPAVTLNQHGASGNFCDQGCILRMLSRTVVKSEVQGAFDCTRRLAIESSCSAQDDRGYFSYSRWQGKRLCFRHGRAARKILQEAAADIAEILNPDLAGEESVSGHVAKKGEERYTLAER